MHFVWVNKHGSLYSGRGDIKGSVVCPACLSARSPQRPFQWCLRCRLMALKLCFVWSSCAPALLSEACRGLTHLHVLTKAASCGQGREGLKSTKWHAPKGRWAVTRGVCQAGTARNKAPRASPLALHPSEWWQVSGQMGIGEQGGWALGLFPLDCEHLSCGQRALPDGTCAVGRVLGTAFLVPVGLETGLWKSYSQGGGKAGSPARWPAQDKSQKPGRTCGWRLGVCDHLH